jgi:hypothetical protein
LAIDNKPAKVVEGSKASEAGDNYLIIPSSIFHFPAWGEGESEGAHKNSEKREYITTWVKDGGKFENWNPSYAGLKEL